MILKSPRIPKCVHGLASNAVVQLLAPIHMDVVANVAGVTHELAAPHAVYVLDLKQLLDRKTLAAARLVGWRYLVMHDNQLLATAGVTKGNADTGPSVSQVGSGPFSAPTLRALRAAEKLKDVQACSFEVRVLEIPSLLMVALWLHGARKEILIPVAPPLHARSRNWRQAALKPFLPYNARAFLAKARSIAQNRPRFDDSLEASAAQAPPASAAAVRSKKRLHKSPARRKKARY
jgi:hypothetical protein